MQLTDLINVDWHSCS